MKTICNNSALGKIGRRVLDDLSGDLFFEALTQLEPFTDLTKLRIIAGHQQLFERFDNVQGLFQLNHLAGVDLPQGHLGNKPLQVANLLKVSLEFGAERIIFQEVGHYLQAAIDRSLRFERKHHPFFQ